MHRSSPVFSWYLGLHMDTNICQHAHMHDAYLVYVEGKLLGEHVGGRDLYCKI